VRVHVRCLFRYMYLLHRKKWEWLQEQIREQDRVMRL
jgi:hypothetical protein